MDMVSQLDLEDKVSHYPIGKVSHYPIGDDL